MNIDIDPINFNSKEPQSAKSRWIILAVILVVGAVSGLLAVKKQRSDRENAIFNEPFTTTVSRKTPGTLRIGFTSRDVGGRYTHDFGQLRIVMPESKERIYYGSDTSTLHFSEGHTGSHATGGAWGTTINTKDFTADIDTGPLKFTIDHTTASIGGQQFDIENQKTVVEISPAGTIARARVLP